MTLIGIVGLGTLACMRGNEPIYENPPPPPLRDTSPPTGNPPPPIEEAPEQVVTPLVPVNGIYNPTDANDRRIHKAWSGDACFVYLPIPEGTVIGPPGTPPPREDIACPPNMGHASWDECRGGVIRAAQAPDATSCECLVMGNPPPPPKTVDCPS